VDGGAGRALRALAAAARATARAPELLMPAAAEAVAGLAVREFWWRAEGPAAYARGAVLVAAALLPAAAYVALFERRAGGARAAGSALALLVLYLLAAALLTGALSGLLTVPLALLVHAGVEAVFRHAGLINWSMGAALSIVPIAAALGVPDLPGRPPLLGALRGGFAAAAHGPGFVAALALLGGTCVFAAARAADALGALAAGSGAGPLIAVAAAFVGGAARMTVVYGAPLSARRTEAP